MKDLSQYRRMYINIKEAWYAQDVPSGWHSDEIRFCLRNDDRDVQGEVYVQWDKHSSSSKLYYSGNAWAALAQFSDVFNALAEIDSQDISPKEFCQTLEKCGFVDETARCVETAKDVEQYLWQKRGGYDKGMKHQILFDLGCDLLNKEQYEEAIKVFDMALDAVLDPDSLPFEIVHNKGVALSHLGSHEEALKCFNAAIDLNAQSAESHVCKAGTLKDLGRYEDATEVYDAALELGPQNARIHLAKGFVLARLGMHEKAIKSYNEALSFNPEYAKAYLNKSNAFIALGRDEEALSASEEALRLNPRYAHACCNKAIALAQLHRHEEALEALEETIRIDPEYANAYFHKGIALAEIGRKDEAAQSFHAALQIDPRYGEKENNKKLLRKFNVIVEYL